MTHFRSQHYVSLVTLTFACDLEIGTNCCPWVDSLPTNFGVLGRFVLDLSANTCQTHHVTLPCDFDL